ncbi:MULTISPECIES: DUF397 domain-containing protein [unclassified Streptomyces]|uniref:DUF397 domain-containing protein n=1 Tax=unclassified Streptomyces TaxID=2593676 RepID=UPI0005F96DD4|nr:MULTISPECIES: DUF397 domain-containing protein [unclassified Streptomyces]KJY33287.1 hypothetical protein VR45_20240 [Streptomyces sp. NRRL S-495]
MTDTQWQKSTYSGSHDDCVEFRAADALVELRESDDGENILRTTPTAIANLLHTIKSGELDHHA